MQKADEIQKQWDSERKINNYHEDKGLKVDRTREKVLMTDWCRASTQEKKQAKRVGELNDAISALSKTNEKQTDKQFFSVSPLMGAVSRLSK